MGERVKLTAGQELFYVPRSRFQNPASVVVEKVGRKWASLSNRIRVDIETLIADGGDYPSPGRAYLRKEDHEEEAALNADWAALRKKIDRLWSPPPGMTREMIASIDRRLTPRAALQSDK